MNPSKKILEIFLWKFSAESIEQFLNKSLVDFVKKYPITVENSETIPKEILEEFTK